MALILAAPLLDEVIHLRELLLDLVRIGAGLIDLIDGKDDGDTGCGGVVDGLDGLRHDVVVGCDDDDGDVRHLGATCTHGGEGFMARGVEEGDVSTVGQGHAVGTDMLRDATGLACDHVGVTDVVKQRRLTVIYVAHDGHNRRTRHPILGVVLFFLNGFGHFRADVFRFEAELFGYDIDRFRVESLVDGDHHANAHTGGDDLGDGDVHHAGQVVGRYKLRQL